MSPNEHSPEAEQESPKEGGDSHKQAPDAHGQTKKPQKLTGEKHDDVTRELPVGRRPGESPEMRQSVWSRSRDVVRGPLGRLLLAGVFALNPVVGASIWTGDKFLTKTPGVKEVSKVVYEPPKKLITTTAGYTRDAIAAAITAPAIPIDAVENLYEGLTRTRMTEARGIIEHILEKSIETLGAGIGKVTEIVPKVMHGLEKVFNLLGVLLSAPFRGVAAVEGGVNSVVSSLPVVGRFGHLLSIPLTVAGIHILATSVAPALGLPWVATAWNQLIGLIAGGFG